MRGDRHRKIHWRWEITGVVNRTTITVPADCNESQRRDAQRAAAAAGLQILRLINEPSVGAMAHGYAPQPPEVKPVIVFDFGGSTLDVSLMTIQSKRYSVLAVSGDTHLGGRDFDLQLMQLLFASRRDVEDRDIHVSSVIRYHSDNSHT
jgi:molecular chaperone DnaK (HSP70)